MTSISPSQALDAVAREAVPGSRCDLDAKIGDEVPWVDKLACARVPDLDVLREFKMIMPRSEAMAMDFLKDEAGNLYKQCAPPTPALSVASDLVLDSA